MVLNEVGMKVTKKFANKTRNKPRLIVQTFVDY